MFSKKTLLAALIVPLVVALALAAPAAQAKHKTPVSSVIIVRQHDMGATINARVGDLIEVQLDSGWDPPGGWHFSKITGHAVEYLGDDPPPSSDGTPILRTSSTSTAPSCAPRCGNWPTRSPTSTVSCASRGLPMRRAEPRSPGCSVPC